MTARELLAQLNALPEEALDAEVVRFSDSDDGWPTVPIDGPVTWHPADRVYRGSKPHVHLS
jgi:hypothetical protein